MKRLLASLALAGSSLLIYPLSMYPNAVERCADSTWVFLTNGPDSTTIVDKGPTKQNFCRVVRRNLELQK